MDSKKDPDGGVDSRRRMRWLPVAAMVCALALGAGLFTLARHVNTHDQQHLLTSQAQDARTTISALMGTIESTMSSVGSVAAATDGAQAAIDRLAVDDPSLDSLRTRRPAPLPGGRDWSVAQRGTPSASFPGLPGAAGQQLPRHRARRHRRRRSLRARRAAPPGVGRRGTPRPGRIRRVRRDPPARRDPIPSQLAHLQFALYAGHTKQAPLLLASTKAVPLTGQQVNET